MTKLPQIRPQRVERVLKKLGFGARPGKGSHVVYQYADGRRTVVPVHNRPIRMGTLRAILKQIDVSTDQFLKLNVKH